MPNPFDDKKWEYKSYHANSMSVSEAEDHILQLNEWGELGWEVFAISKHNDVTVFWLKREIE